MGKQEISIPALANIQTEADAYAFLEGLRWGGAPTVCPLCNATGRFYFLAPRDGSTGRKTRTGSNSQRRVWKCADCRKQFSVLTNTVLHGTKIPVRTWLFVIFEFCASKNSVAAREIERKYNLTAKTAWFMLMRIREATKREPLAGMFTGTVVADETWIGGKPGNFSKAKRAERPRGWDAFTRKTDKPAVLSLVNTETGEVRSRIIADVSGATLGKALAEQVDMANTTLVTDEWKGYLPLRGQLAGHQTVVHARDEYVNSAGFTTNHAEGYFGQLKRSIDGTHHYVSREHLPRYLAQFDFMYTNHEATDSARMRRLLGQVDGRRLTYKRIVD
jgi:transposase-like protein